MQRNGSRTFGDLMVQWHCSGDNLETTAECRLHLGTNSTIVILTPAIPSRTFFLADASQQAEGQLCLDTADDGTGVLLVMDYCVSSDTGEQIELDRWQVYRISGAPAPNWRQRQIGTDDWLTITWQVICSEDACIDVRVQLTPQGDIARTGLLNTQVSEWIQPLKHGEDNYQAITRMILSPQGEARLLLSLNEKEMHFSRAVLGRCSGEGPHPYPDVCSEQPETVALGKGRDFQELGCVYVPIPTLRQGPSHCFIQLTNDQSFQQKLSGQKHQQQRAAMIAEAQEFVSRPSKIYPDQFAVSADELNGAMERLKGEGLYTFVNGTFGSVQEARIALKALLQTDVETFLTAPDYKVQKARLQDSLLALLVLDSCPSPAVEWLVLALTVCHLAELLQAGTGTEPSDRKPLLTDSGDIGQALLASPVLPASILPLPAATTNDEARDDPPAPKAYTRPLGCAALRVVQQRLEGYRIGELAHVENLMPGELRERDRSHRLTLKEELNTSDHSHSSVSTDDGYGGSCELAELPNLEFKRAFDQLKQQYESDGLSVTVTGNWTDTFGQGTPQPVDRAVRQLLRHAAERASRRVTMQHQRAVLEVHTSRDNQRFDNSTGATQRIGIYRWVEALYRMRTFARGQRLILEIILPAPGAAYLRRLQTLHGLDPTPPLSPWLAIGSPFAVTRDNYTELATRYKICDLPAPPQKQRILSASLQLRPPLTVTTLAIPAGYRVQSAKLAWAFTASSALPNLTADPPTAQAPTLSVLVGDFHQDLDTSTPSGGAAIPTLDPFDRQLPVAVTGPCEDLNINIAVTCAFDDASPVFQAWQSRVFGALDAAYQSLSENFRNQVQGLAEMDEPVVETRRQLCRQAISCLIQIHFDSAQDKGKHQGWQKDAVALQLGPLFERALDWNEMIYTFYGDYHGPDDPQRWDWLQTLQKCCNAGGLNELLRAGTARLLVPVRAAYALSILYYLISNGRLWPGSDRRVAIHESQCVLAAAIRSRCPTPVSTPEHTCCMILPTGWMILQGNDNLPTFGSVIAKDRS